MGNLKDDNSGVTYQQLFAVGLLPQPRKIWMCGAGV